MNKNNYSVIMAGGIGSRFWPKSTTSHPKQFLDILGVGRTLIQQTFDRLSKICPIENILIVTNEAYRDLIKEQLPTIPDDNVLFEPARRNTAPCIAYANYKIQQRNPEATIIVAPADHLILKEEAFVSVTNQALKYASENDSLLTLGIKPTRPDTGYGYIQYSLEEECGDIRKVITFTEKPDVKLAQTFLDSGEFSWNSGMFIWSISAIQKAFKKHLSEITDVFDRWVGKYGTTEEEDFIKEIYAQCKSISIDYGVLEPAKNVYVINADIGWSDLGTWGSIYTHLDQDENENAIVGDKVLKYDTSGNIIHVSNDKLVVVQGIEDAIIVDSGDMLLICKKDQEQRIKQFVNDVKLLKDEKYY